MLRATALLVVALALYCSADPLRRDSLMASLRRLRWCNVRQLGVAATLYEGLPLLAFWYSALTLMDRGLAWPICVAVALSFWTTGATNKRVVLILASLATATTLIDYVQVYGSWRAKFQAPPLQLAVLALSCCIFVNLVESEKDSTRQKLRSARTGDPPVPRRGARRGLPGRIDVQGSIRPKLRKLRERTQPDEQEG